MDIFASNNLEQDNQERISISGVLLDRHGAECEKGSCRASTVFSIFRPSYRSHPPWANYNGNMRSTMGYWTHHSVSLR